MGPLQGKVWTVRGDVIIKISRFKSVDRYDLFLVLLYNGEYHITFTNHPKGALIRLHRGILCLSTRTKTKVTVSKALTGEHIELP